MKNKSLIIFFLIVSMTVLVTAQLVLAARSGAFVNADFLAPDYNNGASEIFDVGESRTFNYECACGDVPGNSVCSGNIVLEVDAGSGFVAEKSNVCNAGENQACSASHTKVFNIPGEYNFRVFCDENAGTDFTQSSGEYVVLTVQGGAICNEGETQNCGTDVGVCEFGTSTCIGGQWGACVGGVEPSPETCNDLDNDCNSLVDDVDSDDDGFSPCGGMGASNELVIAGLNNDYGRIDVLAYNSGTSNYDTLWSTDTAGITGAQPGGEIGDLTHDGINDFVITRYDGTYYWLELWTYDSVNDEWYLVWSKSSGHFIYVGDIDDFDNDGFDEIFILDRGGADTFEVWGNDASNVDSLHLEAVIRNCTVATYHNGAGDLDNDGTPELFTDCAGSDKMEVYEYNSAFGIYDWVADVTLPTADGSLSPMTIDDMECNGDLNRDGVADCVFCGNSNAAHVLTYSGGTYTIEFSSPPGSDFSQSCGIFDVTNDGYVDFFDINTDGARVWSYQGGSYVNIWTSTPLGGFCEIGASFAGDSDNDGKGEFLYGTASSTDEVLLWESDEVGATSFSNTFSWSPTEFGVNIMIGNLNPFNDVGEADCDDNNENRYPGASEICGNGVDEDCDGNDLECVCVDGDGDGYDAFDASACPTGDDCNDNDENINPGVAEVCGDGIDNNCNNEIDEGCGPVCGDGYCDGKALGEDCRTCPDDCWAGERGACCGDDKCDINKGESAAVCPVDCS